ncbi:sigma-70 family RNA polymerase sigma factor [Clostridium sp. WILCCON 0269]|uniref:Sigma-70 family RNA polymerase sigma factor n=1 Tax=Candidatus Clostridium eludens TaxID=3381663 RepID=A0ABW8SKK1_9CLOT
MINAEEHIPMVHKLVSEQYRHFKSKHSYDDMFQTGCLGLVKATRDFDESRGMKFSTYAYIKIKGELLNSIRSDKWCLGKNEEDRLKTKAPYSLDAFVNAADGNGTTFMELMIDKEEILEDLDLRTALNNLPKNLKTVIRLKYFYGFSQQEIGRILNTNQSYVSRLESKAINVLREKVEA